MTDYTVDVAGDNSKGRSSAGATPIMSNRWNTRGCQLGVTVSLVVLVVLVIVLAIVAVSRGGSSSSSTPPLPGGVTPVPAFPSSPFLRYPGTPSATPVTMPVNLTIAFVADTGLNEDTQALYTLMKAQGATVMIVSGDLDYINNPDGWDALLTLQLGKDFPVLTASGNHDEGIWPQYQQKIGNRWQQANIMTCEGIIGVAHVCTWYGVTIVQVTPGVFNMSKTWKSTPGIGDIDHVDYISRAFAKYPSTWKICAWHKNQHIMQTGEKTDETGWGVYNACLQQGAMIITGHEHSYERTYQMSSFQYPVISDRTNPNNLTLNSNAGIVIVQGLGGKSVRPNYLPAEYWAALDNTNTSAAAASGNICKYNYNGNANVAYCYAIDIKKRIRDQFTITLA